MADWLRQISEDPTAWLLVGLIGGLIAAAIVSAAAQEFSARRHEERLRRRLDAETRLRQVRATRRYIRQFIEHISSRAFGADGGAPTVESMDDLRLQLVGDVRLIEAFGTVVRHHLGMPPKAGITRDEYAELYTLKSRIEDALDAQEERVLRGDRVHLVSAERIFRVVDADQRAMLDELDRRGLIGADDAVRSGRSPS